MVKIFLLLNQEELNLKLNEILSRENIELLVAEGNLDECILQIKDFMPDIVLIDTSIENIEFVTRQIKENIKYYNAQIIFLAHNSNELELLKLADGVIKLPLEDNLLLSIVDSRFKTKQSLDRLSENNKELSRSLYQLNVLYNTSSQFAGTLNTNKLYEIMLDAMEKTLSYDISCLFIVNSLGKPVFSINTIHTPSKTLVNALKVRSILNYKTIIEEYENADNGDFSDIDIIQKTKQTRSSKLFGLEVFNFDSLFAPIKVGDDFFAIVELFRQTPFSSEDVTCFQAISHQVALPLRSAKLYEEISITNKKLEKLERLKSEFVSIVSHELRTPLTPINNSLEIVLSGQAGEITPDATKFISMAKRNIQRLSGIIEDLLDLSRIQTGKLDFKYKKADIIPSLELLQSTFLQVAQEKNIEIQLEIKQKLPEIYVDLRRFEQILSNLVSNALKFTSNNGHIKVTADVVDISQINVEKLIMPISNLNGKYILISVEDDGIGIKDEDIPKIFDKFSQIESSLNRNKGGVGLGLTITKQLIDSHLGAIWVESELKKGAKFNVLLPFFDDLKVFEMDLSQALVNHQDVGILKISSNKLDEVISIFKENKLLNLTKNSKEVFIKDNYYAFIPSISQTSFEALTKTMQEFCLKNDNLNYGIILKNAHSAKYGKDLFKIINLLNS